MMFQKVIARRYAKGLMLVAKGKELSELEEELRSLVDIMADDATGLTRLLVDPAFSPIERKAIINRIADASKMAPVLRHFLLLLVEKNRTMLLPLICDSLFSLIDEQVGRVRANIKSATPIYGKQMDEIRDALRKMSKKEVLIAAVIEPELLGGICVEMAGTIFDGTIKAKLDAIKQELLREIVF